MLKGIAEKEAQVAEQKLKKRKKNAAEDQTQETITEGGDNDEDDDYDNVVSFFGVSLSKFFKN
jgi:hypothetical protein